MVICGKMRKGALGAVAILLVTGCAAGSPDTGDNKTDAAPSGAEQPAQDWQRVGGEDSGFDLSLPTEWQVIDPTQSDSGAVQEGFGLKGAEGELVKRAMEMLKDEGAVFAIDPATETGDYASNVESACTSGGISGSDLESLKKKAEELNTRLGAKNLQVVDVTVGGKQGIKVTYGSTSKPGGISVANTEIQVPAGGDKYCYVNVRAKEGVLPNAEEITNTFKAR